MMSADLVLVLIGELADSLAETAAMIRSADVPFAAQAQEHADNLRAFLKWWERLPQETVPASGAERDDI